MAGAPSLKTIARRGEKAVAEQAKRLERLEVVYVPTDSIKPNQYNPNRQAPEDFELLLRSMREDGFTVPIVVQKATSEIVDGEHRWRAARHLGLEKVPVVFVDMTAEQMRVSTLRHNRARGSEDVELGAQLLRDLRELGALDWAKDSLMLDDAELQKLLSDESAPDALAGEEFSEAWLPSKTAGAKNESYVEADGRASTVSMTTAAEAVIDKAAASSQAASSEEERTKIEFGVRRDNYRLSLIFDEGDADLVRRVLGDRSAEKVLELCRKRLTARKEG